MRTYKSLEAYNFFVSGWVQTIFHIVVNNHYIFKGNVRPSWRVNEKPHHPWVAMTTDAVVITAHCTCMAGYVYYLFLFQFIQT